MTQEEFTAQIKSSLQEDVQKMVNGPIDKMINLLSEVYEQAFWKGFEIGTKVEPREIPDDKPQQPQPISVPFGNVVDNCAAKCCWEHGGVCINPHRDCIDCPKNWNLGFTTFVGTSIEGNISADPKDWHVVVKPKISEDTAWNADVQGQHAADQD